MASPYENAALFRAFDGVLRPGGLALTRGMLEACGLAPGSRLLDVGCGTGRAVLLFQERGYRAVGMDVSAALLAEAAGGACGGESPGPLWARPLFARADAANGLPFRDQSFDAVFLECVLSIPPDPAGVLEECRRVLRPDGRIALSDMYFKDCADAPGGLPALRAALRHAGFVVKSEEDHSRALGEFAARLIWETGSANALRELCRGCGGRVGEGSGFRRTNMGYVAIIAVKEPSRL